MHDSLWRDCVDAVNAVRDRHGDCTSRVTYDDRAGRNAGERDVLEPQKQADGVLVRL
jgi:hypothetical protein